MQRYKVTIENFNGSKEDFITDAGESCGIIAIGFSFRCNGSQTIIHPSCVYKIIVDEIKDV